MFAVCFLDYATKESGGMLEFENESTQEEDTDANAKLTLFGFIGSAAFIFLVLIIAVYF